MIADHLVVPSAAGLAIVIALGWAVVRLAPVQAAADTAAERLRIAARDTTQLAEARRTADTVAIQRRPDADLVTRIQQVLAAAGLPTTACTGVQPRSDQASSSRTVRVQTVQATLVHLTPAEIGAWLAAWRASSQPWRVAELQMTHANAPAPNQRLSDEGRYDMSVVLAAPYLVE